VRARERSEPSAPHNASDAEHPDENFLSRGGLARVSARVSQCAASHPHLNPQLNAQILLAYLDQLVDDAR
jgi:hypothetical protein